MSTSPDALVVGPMKAGTSWIHDYLESRGDVVLPNGVKETFFFDRRFDKGMGWYAAHFCHYDVAVHQLCIEVAPSYFHCPEAPTRIRETLGDVPLIVTLRDPVKRAWSHYLHLLNRGYTRKSLREAVNDFPEILEASRYKTCLNRWQATFPSQDIHVLRLEGLTESVDDFVADLCECLFLPYVAPADYLRGKRNAARVPAFHLIASVGIWGGNMLRSFRLYRIVNVAKRLGLKEMFFGRPGARALPSLSDADGQWLESQLAGEMPESV